jgi:hypothetical protein
MSAESETMIDVAERRAERFERAREHFDGADGPDCTVPGASRREQVNGVWRRHPRYALVEQYGDHGRYFLNLADDLAGVKALAAEGVRNASLPVCYLDLDELSGPEPRPCEGDRVRLTDEGRACEDAPEGVTYYVVGTETDTFDGEAFEHLYLSIDEDADCLSGEYEYKVDECYVEVVEPAWPDRRLPKRYDVAEVVTIVVFNTEPKGQA